MSKFGIGVGDDFPVDDGRGHDAGRGQDKPQDDRAEFEAWKRRRDEERSRREEWQRQRDEWRERKRAFKEKVRQAARESFGAADPHDGSYACDGHFAHRGRFPFFVWPALGLMIPILIVALVISLFAAIFKSPFAFLGLMVLAIGFFMWRHGGHHHSYRFNGPYRDYDFDLKPTTGGRASAPSAQPPAQNGGAIVTPPPSSGDEKSGT